MKTLLVQPLTSQAFAPFGDVVDIARLTPTTVNQGFAQRFGDITRVDVSAEGGDVSVNVFVAHPRPRPINIELMERHPLGTQLFYPLQNKPWLVVVCTDPGDATSFLAFRASGRQGVNYARNSWHHPLLVIGESCGFIVVDRKGPGINLEEVSCSPRRLEF